MTGVQTCALPILVEPLIKTPDDVDAFEYVRQPPEISDLEASREKNSDTLAFSREHNLAVQAFAGSGLATLMFVMGAENMVMFAMEHTEAFKRLAGADSKTNIQRIRLCAEAGADFVKRFGGYEQTNFLNPELFREIVLPLLH